MLLLRSPTSHNAITFTDGTPVTIEQHAKYLGVTLSSDGSTNKDITTRLVKAASTFTRFTSSGATQTSHSSGSSEFTTQSSYHLSHTGWNRAALTTTSDDNRLEAFHSQSLRKILHLKSTYYTQVLQPSARTYTNQEARFLTEQPPSHTTSTNHS